MLSQLQDNGIRTNGGSEHEHKKKGWFRPSPELVTAVALELAPGKKTKDEIASEHRVTLAQVQSIIVALKREGVKFQIEKKGFDYKTFVRNLKRKRPDIFKERPIDQ